MDLILYLKYLANLRKYMMKKLCQQYNASYGRSFKFFQKQRGYILFMNCEDFVQENQKDKPTANRLVFFTFVATPNVRIIDNLLNYRLFHLTNEKLAQ